MKQEEFHRRYEQCPDGVKFELVGGVVYMASPTTHLHGLYAEELAYVLGTYRRATPGTELVPEATTILGKTSEPQPDLALRVAAECGGQTAVEEGYITGPPELLAEVAYSSRAIDLHQKRDDYQRAGVLEYLVLDIQEKQLYWVHFPSGKTIGANRRGVFRSTVFPGLWIHGQALLDRDSAKLQKVIGQGLASREHAAFVKRLERVRKGKK